MLEPWIPYFLCGWAQFQSGQRVKGALLFLSFPSSVALAAHYLSRAQSGRELAIGCVALILAVLIWSFHYLEMQELRRIELPEEGDEQGDRKTVVGLRVKRTIAKKASFTRKVSPNIVVDELYSRGRIAYLRGSMEEAKDCFEQILRQDRADCDAAFQLGRIHHRMGDHRQAEKCFRQCQQLPGGGKWAEEIKKYLQESKN